MRKYRVYFIDRGAHLSFPPEIIKSENDKGAVEKARRLIDRHDIELWHDDRLVAIISSRSLQSNIEL